MWVEYLSRSGCRLIDLLHCTIAEEHSWAVYFTNLSKRGVGALSSVSAVIIEECLWTFVTARCP